MLNIYRRPNSPYWWYKVPVLDDDGHVITYERGSTKRTERAEARLVAAVIAKKIKDRDQLGIRDSGTISDAARRYIAELEASGKPSVKDAKTFLSRLSSKPDSSESISRLNKSWLSRMKADRLAAGLAPRTINNEITFWISVFNKARDEYNMAVDQTASFKRIKMDVKEKTRYLMVGEEAKFLAELDPTRKIHGQPDYPNRHPDTQQKLQDQYDLVVFLLDTGARYSEVASIQWSSVDTINWQTINIYRSKVGNEGMLVMTDRLREVLKRRFDCCGNSYYVFVSPCDPTRSRGYSTKGIRKAIDRAGLNSEALISRHGRFTLHSLRHTFASRLVQAGMSLYAVSRLLGHSDTQMTQRYAHLSPSQVSHQAADILNQLTESI